MRWLPNKTEFLIGKIAERCMATVTIGIPSYQRPDGLSRCLSSLTAQTYKDIRILVSDDCSSDPNVRTIMETSARTDHRIKCHYHGANIGMFANFWFLLRSATTPYFMWSSNDDYWDTDFVATMVELLEANPHVALACGGIRHFDDEHISPTIYSPARFASSGDKDRDLELFLAEPEIKGKSHLLYGLYRTRELKDAVRSIGFGQHDRISEDVMVAFSVMCRHDVIAIDKPFLFKHRRGPLEFAPKRFVSDYGVSLKRHREYLEGLRAACATEIQRVLVRRVMRRRWLYRIGVTSWRKPLGRLLSRLETA